MIYWNSIVGAVLFCVIFIYIAVVALLPMINKRAVRRYYRKHVADYVETRVTFYSDHVAVENALITSTLQWSVIRLVVDTPDGLLFIGQGRALLFWLPNRVLRDSPLSDRVMESVTEHSMRIRRTILRE